MRSKTAPNFFWFDFTIPTNKESASDINFPLEKKRQKLQKDQKSFTFADNYFVLLYLILHLEGNDIWFSFSRWMACQASLVI